MMPDFRNIILGSAILYSPLIFSQENSAISTEKDYQKFKGTLQAEIQKDGEDTISGKQILHPATLPAWLLSIPESDLNQIYSLGISDPGMPEEQARELACLRAKAIIALLIHPKITGITDNYSGEKQADGEDKFTTKYGNLYRIGSKVGISGSKFKQQEYFYTSFGEAIVLMKCNLTSEQQLTDSIEATAEVYQMERQKNNVFETEEKTNLVIHLRFADNSLPEKHLSYSVHTLNNILEINSEMDGKPLPFPYFNFRYIGDSDSLSFSTENNITNKLNYGLWKTYFEVLVQKILFLSQSSGFEIKQVGDNFASGNKNLSREIAEADPSFNITGWRIANNYLSLDVDYLNTRK